MAAPNLSEIVTTTLRNRTGQLADNVSDNTALLRRLRARNRVRPVSGGRTIVQELNYAENGTYVRYSGYEILNINPSEVFTAAEFDWKQSAEAVTISGLEQLQNSGPEQIIDLLEARIENAEQSFVNNMSADVYSDGTADSGKQIGGMQLLVADDPSTGTVGGINRATWSFWRNQTFDATTDGGAAASSANMKSYMNQMYLSTKRNSDVVDLIVADDNYFRFYWESLQDIQRIQRTDTGQAGFMSLNYMGADVVCDGGIGGSCPANHMYFLNTNFIFFRPHRQRNIVVQDGDRVPVNQDAIVRLLFFAGNMTASNLFLQGVIKD